MEQVRVYKVKIQENVLRSIFFTDRNIVIGVIVIIDLLLFLILRRYSGHFFVFSAMIVDMLIIVLMNLQIDRQPVFVILKRFILYAIRKRNERF